MGAAVKAMYYSDSTPVGRDKSLEVKYDRAKKTTMYSPTTTMADFQRLADQVTAIVKASLKPQTIFDALNSLVVNPPNLAVDKAYLPTKNFGPAEALFSGLNPAGPPAGLSLKTGFEFDNDPPTKAKMRQLFPEGGAGLKTVTAADMKTLATALGN